MRRPGSTTPIILDGTTLEGGGQLVRNALCLSALTGTPIEIHNVRGSRHSGSGGLKAQHLACANWLGKACNARMEGAERGSRKLVFMPGRGEGGGESHLGHAPVFTKVMEEGKPWYECEFDIETAGSTGLGLQAILPFILFSHLPSDIPIRLTMKGGTNVSASPSYEYVSQVFLPTLENIGFPKMTTRLSKRGWYAGGNTIGEWTLEIPPRETLVLPAFTLAPSSALERYEKDIKHLHGTFLGPQARHKEFVRDLLTTITRHFGDSYTLENNNLTITCEDTHDARRIYFILVASMPFTPDERDTRTYKLARDWLYEDRRQAFTAPLAERVVSQVAEDVKSGAWVDGCMRDQLVIFQALAQGRSEVHPGVDQDEVLRKASMHAETAAWVAGRLLGTKEDGFGEWGGGSCTKIGGGDGVE
ncbi:RNA 3'-terminal phosphate cyclase domain-containing protein [Neohortaea acidophila]|uniref:RNA 3'-terminal phosphate cyclase domain-containing protein n=1 Tax=Neohortaea acidophila TaxID=245834 RepID=A0A6A6PSS5_9PEZI|nr:RNA 3'-terminal phosphate cyclase domain-containing protein [Neohortaea acidophila]KAF2482826.1 RNA 3'-terminal phosphate cyclase domain-containing protein [Neohortaea acidophila]